MVMNTTTTTSGSSLQFFSQASSMLSSLLSGLQILAIVIAGVAGVVVLIQMMWASMHGDMQGRQAHIKHLQWVLGGGAGVFAFASILNWVVGFFK